MSEEQKKKTPSSPIIILSMTISVSMMLNAIALLLLREHKALQFTLMGFWHPDDHWRDRLDPVPTQKAAGRKCFPLKKPFLNLTPNRSLMECAITQSKNVMKHLVMSLLLLLIGGNLFSQVQILDKTTLRWDISDSLTAGLDYPEFFPVSQSGRNFFWASGIKSRGLADPGFEYVR